MNEPLIQGPLSRRAGSLGERGQREVAIFELGSEPGSFDEHTVEQMSHQGRKPSSKLLASWAARVARNREWRAG
ncbi:hypothetical protein WME91_17255 [Sorangium sp. So ce269]